MYIVTIYDNCEINPAPFVFTDELSAYKEWAKTLIRIAYGYDIIDKASALTALNAIKEAPNSSNLKMFIKVLLEERENVYMVTNGYALCGADLETVIQIFEVEVNKGE